MGKTVEPIKDMNLIDNISRDLSEYKTSRERRIYLMWMTGIWTGLRISDIVGLKKENVKGRSIRLIEKKTGKKTEIVISRALKTVFDEELTDLADEDFLFLSRQRDENGFPKHITTGTALNDLKWLQRKYNIRGDIGCHSMRKTFGYWHYQTNHDLELLREHFNHSSAHVTRLYIGLDVEERAKAINNICFTFKPTRTKGHTRKTSNQSSAPIIKDGSDRTLQGKNLAEHSYLKKQERGKKRRPPKTDILERAIWEIENET